MVGMPITLRCQVTGKHQPKISWNKDNKPLESEHVILRRESIRIRSAVSADQGIYTCVAKNELGTVATRDANVTIATGMYIAICKEVYRGTNSSFYSRGGSSVLWSTKNVAKYNQEDYWRRKCNDPLALAGT